MRLDSERGWAVVSMLVSMMWGLCAGGGVSGCSSGGCWVLHVKDVYYRSRLGSRLKEVANGSNGIVVFLGVIWNRRNDRV